MRRLKQLLSGIDRQSYQAYKTLKGVYRYPDFTLSIDHVQGDPFAEPSRISVRMPMQQAGYPKQLWATPVRRVALEDFVARALRTAIRERVRGGRGTGKSGLVEICAGGQQVLRRNAVILNANAVEARLTMGLPAAGRRVLSQEAAEMFFRELPAVVAHGMAYRQLSPQAAELHVKSVEDQVYLRQWLDSAGLVAFLADGSILPRRSGIDDRPLTEGALPLRAPESLARTVKLPNAGSVRGMGVPRGVTLVVGGGFHGKSTLLHALERGVYDHVPGDGREQVATSPSAMKVRAEDGRAVSRVDISPFIDRLPLGRDTERFTTDNASGSTSQAAAIMEAMECGTQLLLVDEDTSATNFMIRDHRMQSLVAKEKEPITPFLHRVRELFERHGVSTVLVMGGSGDYFEAADTVVMLDTYQPVDVTREARRLAGNDLQRLPLGTVAGLKPITTRRPRRSDLNAGYGRREVKIGARGQSALLYGKHTIELSKVEQLVDVGQTRAVGWLIHYYAKHGAQQPISLVAGLRSALSEVEDRGLDILLPWTAGNLAMPRLHELAAAVNRMRGLQWD